MKRFLCVLALLVLAPACASAAPGRAIFAVVVTRHGVRSFTSTTPAYAWPDWSPVQPGFLTAHGYRLVTQLGRFYRGYFGALGLPLRCRAGGLYVYADADQRTLETARGLIEGACGAPGAIAYFHDARMGDGVRDPLFEGTGGAEAGASVRAVTDAVGMPLGDLVGAHAADFARLQALLDPLCAASCPAATAGVDRIVVKRGIAEVTGPLTTASKYAESLFLEYAQCGPRMDPQDLAAAMRLHVLAYDVNARNAYNPLMRGGDLFAHIVGLLQAKAGRSYPDVGVPDVARAHVAIISGHDTQLGALGGVLHAHWPLGHGLVADDMPPGGALVFVLYRGAQGDARVGLRFVYETLAQFRSDTPLPGGVAVSPVYLPGCRTDECTVPLAEFVALARVLGTRGFVVHDWTA
ncbi:MAG TPA: histidine-type phosphatase, partial [Candidatus Aquilonibacter sp.]